jgi:hypothetical protein
MGLSTNPLELVERMAAGYFDPEVHAFLRASASAWLLAGGEVPLERCMHLPNTPKRMRLAQRDQWIRCAATMTGKQTAYAAAQDVEQALSRFLSRGLWPHLRHMSVAPEGISRKSAALFYVARLNDGEALSAKQIHRVIRHVFPEKRQPASWKISGIETPPSNQIQELSC